MKIFYVKLFFSLFLCLFTTSFVGAYQFTNNLKIGETNPDVLELQRILNSDKETQVAFTGPGSPGNETKYFGNLTKQAVIRLQEKYKEEILLPSGLQLGTGFVGVSTRKKLSIFDINNKISSNTVKADISNVNSMQKSSDSAYFNEINPLEKSKLSSYFGGFFSKVSTPSMSSLGSALNKETLNFFPSFAKDVRVFNSNIYQVKPGQKIVLSGTGFTEKNNVFSFGGISTNPINCQFSTSCEVFVPENAKFGDLNISLENSNGNSLKQGFNVKIFVTNNPVMASVIYSVIPDFVEGSQINSNIILKGERFATVGNYIYTPLGKVGPYNSTDGKTIVFSVKEMPDINKMIERSKLLKVENILLPVRVNNQYGSSEVFFMTILINK